MVTSAEPKDVGTSSPLDGWLRSQRDLLPDLAAECQAKLDKLEAEGESLRTALATIQRVAAAIGLTLPEKKKKKAEPHDEEKAA